MTTFPATLGIIQFVGYVVVLFLVIRAILRMEFFLDKSFQATLTQITKAVHFPRSLIDKKVLVLPPLRNFSFRQVLYRFKFTLFILFLNVYTFIFTTDGASGQIDPAVLESRGFSYSHFADHKWFILFTSNFVHFHLLHLTVNMMMLLIFSGSLELLKGGKFAAIVYLASMNSNVPNGMFLLPGLRYFYPDLWAQTIQYVDVGASLGIIGSLGGLARILAPKIRWFLLTCAVVGAIVGAVYIQNLFGIDHAFSAMIGYFVASYLIKAKAKVPTAHS